MALNKQTFITRTITAIIFAAVMLVGLLCNHWSFFILFSIIHFGCWWEYLKLTEKIHQTFFHIYTKLGLMVVGYGMLLWFCGPVYHINNYGFKENFSLPVSAAGFALLIIGVFQKNKTSLKAFLMAAGGVVYISLSWGLMIHLRSSEVMRYIHFPDSRIYFLLFFIPPAIVAAVWINDTMAYLVGSFIGKNPLTKISPKKTWEGTIGGILLSVVLTGLMFQFLTTDVVILGYTYRFPKVIWFVIPTIVSITGTFGDLLESKLKRMAGVKDSGSIMPGHGGFLDRFDSLLLATPFVWLYIRLFL